MVIRSADFMKPVQARRDSKAILDDLLTLNIGFRSTLIPSLLSQAGSIQETLDYLMNRPQHDAGIKDGAAALDPHYYNTQAAEAFLHLAKTLERLDAEPVLNGEIMHTREDDRETLSNAWRTLSIPQDNLQREVREVFDPTTREFTFCMHIKLAMNPNDSQSGYITRMRLRHEKNQASATDEIAEYQKAKELVAELCDSLEIPIRSRRMPHVRG